TMGDVYPELRDREAHLVAMTRQEEERFLDTIEGGMARFDQTAPRAGGAGSDGEGGPVIPGEEAFRLYDTFGFPLDLTQRMARERGYGVDVEGFGRHVQAPRTRSRADRAAGGVGKASGDSLEGWILLEGDPRQEWIGWETRSVETRLLGFCRDGDR